MPAFGAAKASGRQDDFLDLLVWRTGLAHPAFASWAAPRARKLVETGEDLTRLWSAEIEPLVQRGHARIAGLTPGYSAFVLGELARDHGHGLVWRLPAERLAEHRLANAPTVAANTATRLSTVETNTTSPLCWMLGPAGIDFHGEDGRSLAQARSTAANWSLSLERLPQRMSRVFLSRQVEDMPAPIPKQGGDGAGSLSP